MLTKQSPTSTDGTWTGLAILFSLLPVSAFAGFGVQDVGWVVGYGSLGVSPEVAVSSGLAAHLVYLVNIVVLGVLGHLALGWRRSPRASGEREGEVGVAAQDEEPAPRARLQARSNGRAGSRAGRSEAAERRAGGRMRAAKRLKAASRCS